MQFFEHYSEIKKLKPIGYRGHLRNIALDALVVKNKLSGIEKYLEKPRVQFLYIHHSFKDEEQKLHDLLMRLSENHHFISYSEAVKKVLNGNIDKPYISISSDDGFKNNLAAAEILNEFNAKACFFINPYIIAEKSFPKIKEYCKENLNFPPVEFMNWEDIQTLQKWGHEIGSHTWSHINVAETEEQTFVEDCQKTFEVLKKHCEDVKHFAFPYGRFFHFNEMGRKVVFDSGFSSCASAERGSHINQMRKLKKDELCVLRDHVILDWNLDHILYFLASNSKKASFDNNFFPY